MTTDSTIAKCMGVDVSFPRLFHLVNKNYIFANPTEEYELSKYIGMCKQRRDVVDERMQIEYRREEGDVNIDYWNEFCRKLVKNDYSVDWEVANKFGQNKWRNSSDKLITLIQ